MQKCLVSYSDYSVFTGVVPLFPDFQVVEGVTFDPFQYKFAFVDFFLVKAKLCWALSEIYPEIKRNVQV